MKPALCCTLTAVLVGSIAAAADKRLHIPAGRSASFMWTVQDAAGFRWDISSNGTVSDGTNDAYDGGMQLQISGSSYPSVSNARLSRDGREVEIGPYQYSGLEISRRIHVNVKGGYCRWIDIFENPTASQVSLSLRYYSNLGDGIYRLHTTSGKPAPGKDDWGVVTAGSSTSSSRPAIVHVFGSPGAKFLPRFQYNQGNDSLYYHATIKVPAKGAAALCFFEAQRRPFSAAVKFLKDFHPNREIRALPRALRKVLLNMGPPGLRMGELEVTRDDEADLVILRNGDEYRGTLTNQRYALRTEFGEVDFPAEQVVALAGAPGAASRVLVVLADGQVLAGELTSGPLNIRLGGGSELPVPAGSIVQASYRISPTRPEEIAPSGALLELRSGPRLAFAATELKLEFLTPHGNLALAPGDLRSIEMDTPAGGLHRALFRNRSVLAGLLVGETVALKLRLGPDLSVARQRVRRLSFAADDDDPTALAALTFRNADVAYGRLTDAVWVVRSKFGEVKVAPGDIAEAAFSDESLGQVKLVLRDGTKIGGKLAGDHVRFRIEPGPELKVHVGQLAAVRGAPGGAPASRPGGAGGAVPAPAAAPPHEAVNKAELAAVRAELERLKAVQEALQAKAAALRSQPGGANTEKALAEIAEFIARTAQRSDQLKKVLAEIQQRQRARRLPPP